MLIVRRLVSLAVITLALGSVQIGSLEFLSFSVFSVCSAWVYALGPAACGVLGSLLFAGGLVSLNDNLLPLFLSGPGIVGCVPFAFAFADASLSFGVLALAVSQVISAHLSYDLYIYAALGWLVFALACICLNGRELVRAKWPLKLHLGGVTVLILICGITANCEPLWQLQDYSLGYNVCISQLIGFFMILYAYIAQNSVAVLATLWAAPLAAACYPKSAFAWSLANLLVNLPHFTPKLVYTLALALGVLALPPLLPSVPFIYGCSGLLILLLAQYTLIFKQRRAKLRYDLELEALLAIQSL